MSDSRIKGREVGMVGIESKVGRCDRAFPRGRGKLGRGTTYEM